ncbi:MAG: hypothetical protein ACYDIA_17055 [Candidatus Humimicrobiaceae bacterium]
MKNFEKLDYYIFFPYLKISQKMNFCGIELSPINDIDNSLEKNGIDFENKIKTLNKLKNFFYLSKNYKIKNFAFTIIKERSDLLVDGFDEKIHLEYSKVLKIRELFIYIYSSLHPTALEIFLDRELCNVFALREENDVINFYKDNKNLIYKGSNKKCSDDFYSGYCGLLNEKILLYLSKDDKVFPPHPSFNQNYYQDIYADIKGISQNSVFNFFIDKNKLLYVFENVKLLQSLKWYNKSISWNSPSEEQLINLSIAFESLLELDEEKINKSFINSILMILGYNERLKYWAQQFYDARSDIIHKGKTNKLFFEIGNQNKGKYRELTSYGRLIFQIIFNTLINGEYLKTITELKDLFVCNRERFNEIIGIIGDGKDFINKFNSIEKIIKDISKYRFISEDNISFKDIIECINKITEGFLKNKLIEEDEIAKVLNDFIDLKNLDEKLIKFEAIYNCFKKKNEGLSKELLLYKKLLESVWGYLLTTIFFIKQNKNNSILAKF